MPKRSWSVGNDSKLLGSAGLAHLREHCAVFFGPIVGLRDCAWGRILWPILGLRLLL